MNIPDRIYNGNRAKEVLENEVFIQAFEDIKKEIVTQWEQSPARDSEGREKLWNLLKLADKLEMNLKTTLETGKLAMLEIEHKRTLKERLQDAIG